MIHIQDFTFNAFQERCSLVWDDEGFCAVVDPGYTDGERSQLIDFITSGNLQPVCVMLTHGHFDHIYGMSALAATYKIPVHADMKEMYSVDVTNRQLCSQFGFPMPDEYPIIRTSQNMNAGSRAEWVMDGDFIDIGSLRFDVLSTPGHSKGGLCFLERNEKVLFSGDTLFAGAIGRTDHPGGDYDVMMKSIFEKLLLLDGETRVLPGHGPSSDISTERMTNPFLMPFNEPYED